MSEQKMIQAWTPEREWLVRCGGEEPEVRSIGVSMRAVEISALDWGDVLRLERSQIAEFRVALDEAIDQTEVDLRARAGR